MFRLVSVSFAVCTYIELIAVELKKRDRCIFVCFAVCTYIVLTGELKKRDILDRLRN